MTTELEKALETIKGSLCTGEAKGRNIVVLDKGWIFVGNLTRVDDGYILTDARNIRRWETVGFGGLTKSSKTSKAVMDDCQPVKFKDNSMIFYAPVSEDW